MSGLLVPFKVAEDDCQNRIQAKKVTDVLSWLLRGVIAVVALVRMAMMGWREASLPLPVEVEVHEGTGRLEVTVGAAATKLVAARRRAGMKERTRIVSEM